MKEVCIFKRTRQALPTQHWNGGAVSTDAGPLVAVTCHSPGVGSGVTAKQRSVATSFHPVRRTSLP